MPAPITPNTIKLVLTMTQEASTRVAVFHYRTLAPHVWTQTELQAIATNWWAAMNTSLRNATNNTLTFNTVFAIDLGTAIPQSATYTIPAPNVGLQTGEASPANAAAVISWRTPYSGRSYRGRTYMAGLSEIATNGSLITSSQLANLVNVATAFLLFNNGTGQVAYPAVKSTVLNNSTIILAYVVDIFIDSQRRRLLGRGN